MNRKVIFRGLRGGPWYLDQRFARCSYRVRVVPDVFASNLGFRLARKPMHVVNSVVHGGSWYADQRDTRCAYRYWSVPDDFLSILGFRLTRKSRR